jgi:hypothetical protein
VGTGGRIDCRGLVAKRAVPALVVVLSPLGDHDPYVASDQNRLMLSHSSWTRTLTIRRSRCARVLPLALGIGQQPIEHGVLALEFLEPFRAVCAKHAETAYPSGSTSAQRPAVPGTHRRLHFPRRPSDPRWPKLLRPFSGVQTLTCDGSTNRDQTMAGGPSGRVVHSECDGLNHRPLVTF